MTTEEIQRMREFAAKRTGRLFFPCNKTAIRLLQALDAVEVGKQLVTEIKTDHEKTFYKVCKKLIVIRTYALDCFRRGHVAMKPLIRYIDEILNGDLALAEAAGEEVAHGD